MKKVYLTFIAYFTVISCSFGQWTNIAGTGNYYLNSGNVGIGNSSPTGLLSLGGGLSAPAWGISGINFQSLGGIYTDSSTPATTTVSTSVVNSFGIPTLAATNSEVTYTDAATVYIAGVPRAGTNVSITNAYALKVLGKSYFGGSINIGNNTSSTARLLIAGGINQPAWGTSGLGIQVNLANGVIDNSSSGLVANAVINSLGSTAMSATNPTTYTNASTLYIGGAPRASANVAITNAFALDVSGPISFSLGSLHFNSLIPNVSINGAAQSLRFQTNTTNLTEGIDFYNANTSNDLLFIRNDGNVGIGINTPENKLDVNGTIHSKEVKVDLNGWPDYVFTEKHSLPTLDEIKRYIDQNHHLPDIPSEREITKNGLNLGEINRLLVKKVEELTLYLIEKDKEVRRQNNRINNLEDKYKILTGILNEKNK
jgi:hypothetical protein